MMSLAVFARMKLVPDDNGDDVRNRRGGNVNLGIVAGLSGVVSADAS